jgi:hypothetical protein
MYSGTPEKANQSNRSTMISELKAMDAPYANTAIHISSEAEYREA